MAIARLPDDRALTLSEWQEYIEAKITERGLGDETAQQKFMLLVEEVGELAKALRPLEGIKVSKDSEIFDAAHEAADVFWLLVCLCNSYGIDLDSALRSKEIKNSSRNWQ